MFRIKYRGTEIQTFKTMDEVVAYFKEETELSEHHKVEEFHPVDVTDMVKNLMVSETDLEALRNKHFGKKFQSAYLDEDYELPYTFDLLYDIKSVGHLAYKFIHDGESRKLLALALEHGITEDFMRSLPLRNCYQKPIQTYT